ncbi:MULTISPECIES: DUF2924 domain-containing protein [unclassified Bartonella]
MCLWCQKAINEGKIYKSLKVIAKHITGINWNSHLFFGLVRRG